MPKSQQHSLRCPECNALLEIDADTGEVIFHKAAKQPPAGGKDFDKLLAELDDEKSQAEALFEREFEALKNRDRLLEKKFDEAVRQAEDSPDDEPPLRPFDLD